MAYTQFTQEERYQISVLLKAEHDQTEIAMILGRHKSTISREIRRNTGLRGYRPVQAQRLTDERRKFKLRPRISDDTWVAVDRLLNLDWSPEQISRWLKSFCAISISHEWIYQYVLQDKAAGVATFTSICRPQSLAANHSEVVCASAQPDESMRSVSALSLLKVLGIARRSHRPLCAHGVKGILRNREIADLHDRQGDLQPCRPAECTPRDKPAS